MIPGMGRTVWNESRSCSHADSGSSGGSTGGGSDVDVEWTPDLM